MYLTLLFMGLKIGTLFEALGPISVLSHVLASLISLLVKT